MEVRTYRLFIRHQLVAVRRKKAEQHKIVRISPFYTHTKLTRKNARNAEQRQAIQHMQLRKECPVMDASKS